MFCFAQSAAKLLRYRYPYPGCSRSPAATSAAARLIGAASNAAATALVHAGAVLQLLILANFLHRCRREGERPAPFWNPPTVNCAVTAIVAAELGAAPWLSLTSMGLALLLQLLVNHVALFECLIPGPHFNQIPCYTVLYNVI